MIKTGFRLNECEIQKVRDLYDDGYDIKSIATEMRISWSTVRRHTEDQIELNNEQKKIRSQKRAIEARTLIEKGWTKQQVATKLGVSVASVIEYLCKTKSLSEWEQCMYKLQKTLESNEEEWQKLKSVKEFHFKGQHCKIIQITDSFLTYRSNGKTNTINKVDILTDNIMGQICTEMQ